MCTLPFKESINGLITLPEDEPLVIENFILWLHANGPHPLLAEPESLISLAIFADKYRICLLVNQISDVVREGLQRGTWKLTPDKVRMVYASTGENSVLRRLYSLAFTIAIRRLGGTKMPQDDYNAWKAVFCDFGDLGWDCCRSQMGEPLNIAMGGACRFHDHSDIANWERRDTKLCPFPDGAPLKMPESRVVEMVG